jgi:alpha-galactosidase
LDRVRLAQIEIRYRIGDGVPRSFALATPSGTAEASSHDEQLGVAVRFEYCDRGILARASVANRGGVPLHLDTVRFALITGFEPSAPARFFKHGYQSWSASGSRTVGAERTHPRDSMPRIIRLSHQSEAVRPPDAPEACTSEIFTIVECGGEYALAGFIDGASSLTTLTVLSPDQILARALMDGVELASGATREVAPFYFTRSRDKSARLAARWASRIGEAMNARRDAPFQRGWCSWYHYFHAITEEAMRSNLAALSAMRSEFPVGVVQLDDGFQAALGDWDRTNPKFPGGLARLADEIRAAGFEAGIWTAPFLAARDSRLMSEHPQWFIRHDESGQPLRAAYNPNWTMHEDKFAYALDPSHPDFRAHLEALFHKLVHEFGYSYLKLDFLYAAAAEGLRHDPGLTRAQTLRRGLEAIRGGAGGDAFILGCGCPLGPAIGIVDGMRIGPDVAPYWGGADSTDPSTVHALDAIIARSFMHRRLWLNDPDCLMLRARETKLTRDERLALAAVISGSGGMLLISDDMALLGAEESRIFRGAADLALEMDRDAHERPVLALDLMDDSAVRAMVKETDGGYIAIVLNRGESAAALSSSAIGEGSLRAAALGDPEAFAADPITLPAHSARIVRIRRD